MKNNAPSARPRVTVSDSYIELIRQFPLRPLRSEAEHAAAMEILNTLVGREDLDVGQRDYMEAVARFIADFEQEHHHAELAARSPVEVVKFLMEQHGMNTTDLGSVIGSRGLASEILNGKRGISKVLINKLARHFKVEPGLFLEQVAAT